MKKTSIQAAVLAVLVVTALTIWYRDANSAGASESAAKAGPSYKPMSVDNPQIHWDRLTETLGTEYAASGRDIFNWHLPPPPPPPRVHVPEPGDSDYVAPVPPPPPPPRLPLKFFGIGTDSKGNSRRAFLTDGDEVFIVAEGDTVLGHFKILRIAATSLDFEEIRSGRRASKLLEEPGPGA